MRSVHAFGTLALSIAVFALAITAALMGTRHDGLYAIPGSAGPVTTPFHAGPQAQS